MPSKTILITGASGFIGACLARSLATSGQDVHLILRGTSNLWRLKGTLGLFKTHDADLTDYGALSKTLKDVRPDTVYHLATYGAYSHQKDERQSIETNILGTMNLVKASADYAKSFINVSSSSEYGTKRRPMREGDILEPNSIYGVTKAAATLYCQHMARENGLPITTFRIFAAYGYYEEQVRLMPSLILPFLKNESPRLSSTDSVRDFIFIDDIIDALAKAAKTNAARGQILNLGTGTQHTLGDVAAMVKDITGSSKDVLWGAAQKRQAEPGVWRADMSKTLKALGWKPKYKLREGLTKCVRWYKANRALYSAGF